MSDEKTIDKKTQFEKLCGLQCSIEEIANFFDSTAEEIEAWCMLTYNQSFDQVFAKKSDIGKISLRRAQFKLAEKNAAMAIWLGRQYLNQQEPEEEKEEKTSIVNNLDSIREKFKLIK